MSFKLVVSSKTDDGYIREVWVSIDESSRQSRIPLVVVTVYHPEKSVGQRFYFRKNVSLRSFKRLVDSFLSGDS